MDFSARRVAVTAATNHLQLREDNNLNLNSGSLHVITTSTPQRVSGDTAMTSSTLHNQDLVDVMAEL